MNRERGSKPETILFFDGHCSLCNRAIDFIFSRDSNHIFRFAPLQGETAKKHVPPKLIQELTSLVLYQDGKITTRSDAALEVARLLRLKGAGFLRLIPRPLRDIGYNLVARTRYRIFGRTETCRLPTPDEKKFFLN